MLQVLHAGVATLAGTAHRHAGKVLHVGTEQSLWVLVGTACRSTYRYYLETLRVGTSCVWIQRSIWDRVLHVLCEDAA